MERLKIGAWLEDTSGIYQVTAIHDNCIEYQEIELLDNDQYKLSDKKGFLTNHEVSRMEIIS